MKKAVIKVVSLMQISYEHEKHLEAMTKSALEGSYQITGAGVVGGKVYGYSLKRIGKRELAP